MNSIYPWILWLGIVAGLFLAGSLMVRNDHKRYFLVTYSAYNGAVGNLWFELNGFPANKKLQEAASQKVKDIIGEDDINPVVTNIYEFKNEKDYLSFCGENKP